MNKILQIIAFLRTKMQWMDVIKHGNEYDCIITSYHNPFVVRLVNVADKSQLEILSLARDNKIEFFDEKKWDHFRRKFSLTNHFKDFLIIDPDGNKFGTKILKERNFILKETKMDHQSVLFHTNLTRTIKDSMTTPTFYAYILPTEKSVMT